MPPTVSFGCTTCCTVAGRGVGEFCGVVVSIAVAVGVAVPCAVAVGGATATALKLGCGVKADGRWQMADGVFDLRLLSLTNTHPPISNRLNSEIVLANPRTFVSSKRKST